MNKQAEIQREITPLTPGDCLLVFDRLKSKFDFPIHFHPEYELNFILDAPGAERIVGDHKSFIDRKELVLVGPNVYHGWDNGLCQSEQIHEITIQFHRDLIHASLLERNMMQPIRLLLANSAKGISFSKTTIDEVAERLLCLSQKNGIEAFVELIAILHQLSLSKDQQILCPGQTDNPDFTYSEQMKKVFGFIEQKYQEKIRIEDVASDMNMTESTLSRFIKKRTGKSFVNFLNDYRLGFACRWLTETNQSVSEIADRCGFYNISNFNRIFKKNKGCTPLEYRQNFSGIKRVS